MARGLKLAVIGGGSTYTPELIEGIIKNHERFPVKKLVMVDIPEGRHKLAVVGALAQRMVKKSGLPIQVDLTFDREEALYGADFVSTQLRVGLLKARALDESIPLKYDMIGQETTGPGGMMKALRTIPVMLDIAKDMKRLCPDAWLLNFTNPSGMVTEALNKYADIRTVGLCNSPIGMVKWLCQTYDVDESRINCEFTGLNHLHYVTKIEIDGEDKLSELIGRRESYAAKNVPEGEWNKNFLRALGAIPSYYLKYYYMNREMLLEEQEAARGGRTRAQVVQQLEDELLALYSDPKLDYKPKQLEERGGAFYSEAAVRLMCSLHNDTGDVQTVNVSNNGTLDFLRDDDCIEVSCRIHRDGPVPVPVATVPEAIKGLICAVKTYERLAIEAAVTGDRDLALLALAHHPLVPSVGDAERMLDEMLNANREHLPLFFR